MPKCRGRPQPNVECDGQVYPSNTRPGTHICRKCGRIWLESEIPLLARMDRLDRQTEIARDKARSKPRLPINYPWPK